MRYTQYNTLPPITTPISRYEQQDWWSRWSGLNRRPTVYETVALPLSYTGKSL